MFCRNCGNSINDSAAFCPFCGSPVAAKMPQQIQNSPQPTARPTLQLMENGKESNKGLWITLAVAAVIVIVLIATNLIPRRLGKNDPNYSDIVRCLQGRWYVDDNVYFSFDGQEFREYREATEEEKYYYSLMAGETISKLYSPGKYKIYNEGELTLIYEDEKQEDKYIFYKYDENDDSITLTYRGYALEKN